MSNQVEVFKNEQFGEVRTVVCNNEPWFVGKDVASILGYANPNEALADHVMDDDKLNSKMLSSCQIDLGQRGGWLINESGLYSLILGSKLPTAKNFKHWITSEVFPTAHSQKEMRMMNDESSIMTIQGVDCYERDGIAYLKLEAVAKGLGFTQTQNKPGGQYTSIRWDRIEQYLSEIGFPHKWGKDDFIPENIFYRLAMKAKNEVAEKFQAKVADEIIPTIRKTGGYVANDKLFIDTYLPGANQQTVMLFEAILGQVRNLNAEKARLMADNEEMKPKAQFADKICKSHDNILLRAMAKLLCDEGFNIGEKRIFSLLRDKRVLMKNNEPYQTYVDRGYFVVDEYSYETPYGTRLGHTTKITPAGQVWLVNKCSEWHV